MNTPFAVLEEKKPSIFDRLLNRRLRQNAVVRVNNFLARATDVRTVTMNQITAVAEEFRLNLGTDLAGDCLALYTRYVEHCLADLVLSKEDEEALKHLKCILCVQDSDARDAQEKISGTLYRTAVQDAVADGFISEAEKKKLERIRIDMNLSEELANRVYADCAKTAFSSFFDAALADGRLSPAEEEELRQMAASLRLTIKHDTKTSDLIEKFRKLWQIEEGDLPVITPNLNLPRNEVCHAHIAADLHEVRTVTRRVNFGGYSTSVKVFKGFYIRSGSYRVGRETENVLSKIDSGDLYVTNKRLIFMGNHKNVTIRVANVLSVSQYTDGIEVEKGSGKNPFFLFSDNGIFFAKILQRVMSEA